MMSHKLTDVEIIDAFRKVVTMINRIDDTIELMLEEMIVGHKYMNYLNGMILSGGVDAIKTKKSIKALDFRRKELDDFKSQFEESWSGFLKNYHEREGTKADTQKRYVKYT